MLVLLTGLPGTGKSTIADALARELDARILSADPIDAELAAAGVPNPDGRTGYEAMKSIAATELDAGRSVIIDAVNPFDFVRDAYASIAAAAGTEMRVIITTCSDVDEHRRRVEARVGEQQKVDWSGVEFQIGYYQQFDGDALVLDAMNPAEDNCTAAANYVRR